MSHDLSEAIWRKSSHSGNTGGECVELAQTKHVAGVRDSKNPTGPVLTFGQTELAKFLDVIKTGRLNG